MTREQTKAVLMTIIAAYPSYKPAAKTVDVWAAILEPYDYKEIGKGLAAYMRSDTSGFAPTPGQIIAASKTALAPDLSDGEAWGMVVLAMRNSTYGAEREFAKLPEVVRRAVGSPAVLTAWGQLAESSLAGAEASFKRSYKAEVQRADVKDSTAQRISLAETDRYKIPAMDTQAARESTETVRKHQITDALAVKILERLDYHAQDTPKMREDGIKTDFKSTDA